MLRCCLIFNSFTSFDFSICNSSLFGIALWKCNSWVWSVFQLSNNEISYRTRILQFSQLVRRSSMVSIGTYHWWHHLSWFDGDIGRTVSLLMAAEYYRWHSQCLRIFGTVLFLADHIGHVPVDEGDTRKSHSILRAIIINFHSLLMLIYLFVSLIK